MTAEGGPGRPFVGRSETVEILRRQWDDARAGAGGATLLVGEAGVGKSALVTHLAEEIRAGGVPVLVGRALPLDDPPPFSLLRSAIQGLRDASPRSEADRSPLVSDPVLIGFAPRLGEEALPDLVGLEQRLLEELGRSGEPAGAARDRAIALLADQFLELTHHGPLVLVLEDVYRGDESSLSAVAFLADRLREEPFWLLATSRPAVSLSEAGRLRLERFEETSRARTVPLHPLTSREVADFLRISDPSREFSPDEVARRFSESGGFPIVLESLGHRPVPTGPASLELPTLAADEQRALDGAAVLGPEFSFENLLRVSGEQDEEAFAEVVDRLVEKGLLLERSGETLTFTADRLRELAYSRLSDERRKILHWSAGETLEATGRAGVSTVFALARHFYLGSAGRKSVKYNRLAAEVADRALSPEVARDHLVRAAESQRDVRPENLEEESELVLELARVSEELGQLPEAERMLREFLGREQNDPRLSALRRASLEIFLSRVLTDRGNLPEAVRLAEGVLAAPVPNAVPALQIGAHHQLGMASYYEGRYAEALTHHTEEVRLARQLGNPFVTLRAQIWRVASLAMLGSTDEAVAEARTLTGERDRLGSARESAQAHLFLGDILADARCTVEQRRDALAEYARAVQFAERSHDPRRVGWARYKTGELRRETGQFDEAGAELRAAREIFTEIGDQVGLSMAIKVEGQIALDRGDLDLAGSRLQEAYRLLQGLHHTLEEIDVVLRLAQLSHARGERANALRHVGELDRMRLMVLRPDLAEEFSSLRRDLGTHGGDDGGR